MTTEIPVYQLNESTKTELHKGPRRFLNASHRVVCGVRASQALEQPGYTSFLERLAKFNALLVTRKDPILMPTAQDGIYRIPGTDVSYGAVVDIYRYAIRYYLVKLDNNIQITLPNTQKQMDKLCAWLTRFGHPVGSLTLDDKVRLQSKTDAVRMFRDGVAKTVCRRKHWVEALDNPMIFTYRGWELEVKYCDVLDFPVLYLAGTQTIVASFTSVEAIANAEDHIIITSAQQLSQQRAAEAAVAARRTVRTSTLTQERGT